MGELCNKITKGTTPTTYGMSFVDKGINYIKAESITKDSRIDETTFAFITKETHDKLKRSQIELNDILFSMAGMFLGKTAIVSNENFLPANTNQAVAIIRVKDEIANPFFVFYYLNQKSIKAYINLLSAQSAQPNINLKEISDIEISLPHRDLQNKIVQILKLLDNKIDLNNAINNNLEQQAMALFKSWFVENENIERRIIKAEDFFNISIGKTPPRKEHYWFSENPNKNIIWVSISDMGSCGTFISNSSEYLTKDAVSKFNIKLVPDNTVLLSFKLTVGRISITDGKMVTNEAIAHFVTDKKEINEYLYCYLRNFNFQIMGSTSSIATALNSKIIKAMPFILPTQKEINDFHRIMNPIFEQIKSNQKESQKLSQLRDTLLPKLMTGEIDISDVAV